MGIIKKFQIEDQGVLHLRSQESEPAVTSPAPVAEIEIPAVELTPEEESFHLEKIEDKAREILEQAQTEANRLREEARQEGIEEGRKEGLNQIADQIQEALETLNQAIKARREIVKDAEPEILRLVIKIAEQVIRSEVSMHRDVILNIVSEALGRVSDRETILVKAHRDDIEHIKKYKEQLSGIVDGVKNFSILEDAQVEPGGVVIETNLGYVDARISTKLKALEEAFKKLASKSEDGS